ncbi:hypothetical protein BDY21DRAFT_370034 [Lineolata rhizophorae]|uniref:Uncharacterized protein n=1 Tax=Lineolata rhizophorae TaxID=578093 RepID=A0A6A6P830_9PEZI|nr:hypothetical protein BDY21DRAFT_370034 [Lineolata rhizophorae]
MANAEQTRLLGTQTYATLRSMGDAQDLAVGPGHPMTVDFFALDLNRAFEPSVSCTGEFPALGSFTVIMRPDAPKLTYPGCTNPAVVYERHDDPVPTPASTPESAPAPGPLPAAATDNAAVQKAPPNAVGASRLCQASLGPNDAWQAELRNHMALFRAVIGRASATAVADYARHCASCVEGWKEYADTAVAANRQAYEANDGRLRMRVGELERALREKEKERAKWKADEKVLEKKEARIAELDGLLEKRTAVVPGMKTAVEKAKAMVE